MSLLRDAAPPSAHGPDPALDAPPDPALAQDAASALADLRRAAYEAVAARRRAARPWVLDPEAGGVLPVRTPLARDLLTFRPAVVRGNATVAGVHVGQTGLPAGLAREICGPGAATAEELAAAAALPPGTVDYLGAVHATRTEPDHPPALGVGGFAPAARYVRAFGRTLPEGALS